jgi:hypothetical protein
MTDHPDPDFRDIATIATAPGDDTTIAIGVDVVLGQVVLRFEPIAPDEEDIDIQDGELVVAPRHVCLLTPDQADLLAELLEHAAHHARSDL